MIRSARTSLLRHDHPASRIRALATGRRDQLQLFDAVLESADVTHSVSPAECFSGDGGWAQISVWRQGRFLASL